jgi:hypothetical protein
MKELVIVCHESIGPIKLGIQRIQLRDILEEFGAPFTSSRKGLDFFCNNFIQVEYEEDQTASFIGISSHVPYSLYLQRGECF